MEQVRGHCLSADYVDNILKGAKAAGLPVLLRADQVIE